MKKKIIISLFIFYVLAGECYAQDARNSFKFYKLAAYSGDIIFNGHYRNEYVNNNDFTEKENNAYFSGGLMLNTTSYFLHPNFLTLELNAGYVPETRRDTYLVTPDQSEVRTVKKLDILAALFSNKKVNMNVFANFDESYSNRENLTDIKSNTKHWGASMSYRNNFLPVYIDYHKRKWAQKEIQSGRTYTMDQTTYQARFDKSFSNRDRQQLNFSYNDIVNENENSYIVRNKVSEIYFSSNINLDENRKYNLNTVVSNFDQRGDNKFSRFQAMEHISAKLPANLSFTGNYSFYHMVQQNGTLNQYNTFTALDHKLYKSLNSRIFFEFNKLDHSLYNETNNKIGFDLEYTKIIPGGQLQLTYTYFRYHQTFNSSSNLIHIELEEYVLTDTKIVLLKRPYIDIQTVVVKDYTGTLIYQLGIDYLLIETGKYIEIRRIPGGLIANNATVYVNYTATQPGSYKYDTHDHIFSANFLLFKNKLNLYYRLSYQNYFNLENTDYIVLNYYTQNVVGFRLNFGIIDWGAEYEDYKSSILPYHMARFYINMQKNFKNKLLFTLNGNLQFYKLLHEIVPQDQRYIDITGKVAYTLFNQTKLNLDVMYRNQAGRGIDLDLITSKLELTSVVYKIYLTLGLEVYNRNYIGEIINFKGVYVQILRKF